MRLSRRTLSLVFPFLLVLITLAAYAPAMRAGFIWDDDSYLTENPVYNYPDALARIWQVSPVQTPQYYPLVFTSFYFEQALWGLDPAGFHAINVLLHAGSALLLWRVLKRLKVPGAEFAAAVFALHPMMVESVAWVTERKNTFSTFFFLASLLTFVLGIMPRIRSSKATLPAEAAAPTPGPRRNGLLYGASLLLFILALLSKSVACGLAPVLVLILWWKKRPALEYLLTLPYWILGLVSGLFTVYLERTHVGAVGEAWQLSPVEKILLAGRAVCFYAWKLLVPADLSFYYMRWQIDPSALWQWLFPLIVTAALVGLFLARKKVGRGPFAGGASFFVLLFPALGFFALFPMLFSWVADHFAYHATVAFIPLVCAAATLLVHRLFPGNWGMRIGLAVAVVFVLAIRTYSVAGNYESNGTLFYSVLAYNERHGEPHHWNALSIVSGQLHQKAEEFAAAGDKEKADILIEQAFEFDKESCENYLKAVPNGGEYPVGLNNIAGYYLYKKDFPKALDYAERALKSESTNHEFLLTLGNIYRDMGDREKAAAAYVRVVSMKPRNTSYRMKLARMLLEMGNTKMAAEYIDSVLKLDSRNIDAHMLRGFMLAQMNQLPQAIEDLRAALSIDPDNLEAMDTFARVVSVSPQAGETDVKQALAVANVAVDRTQGTNLAYVDTLAMALNRAGRVGDAVSLLQRAIPRVPPADNATRQSMIRHLTVFSGGKATIPSTMPATAPATGAASMPASAPATRPAH